MIESMFLFKQVCIINNDYSMNSDSTQTMTDIDRNMNVIISMTFQG